jgi:RHS repeat-associated protein
MPTTKYIWDEQNYLAEADGNDNINVVYTNEPQQYGNLVSTRISGTTSYHHFDALGSTRQLTSSIGALSDSVIYDASGTIINRTGGTAIAPLWIGTLGYYFDSEPGTLAVRARFYVPTLARWMSIDPLRFRDGTNTYAYTHNSPVSAVDPSGRLRVVGLTKEGAPKLQCGKEILVDWDFVVDDVDQVTQKAGAPCDGYIIQRVGVTCRLKRCPERHFEHHVFYYFEAWPITKGSQYVDDRPAHDSKTDTAKARPTDGFCGRVNQDGEIRFYCKEGDGGTGELSAPEWRKDVEYGVDKTLCSTSPGVLLSFDGANGTRFPPFWTKVNTGASRPGKRAFQLFFCCCPPARPKLKLDFSPSA